MYFSNSGAEANEGAVKLAKKVTKRPAVIAFKRAFHGRTLAAASLTASGSLYRKITKGLLPSVYHAEYPYPFRSGLSEDAETERCIRQLEELFQLQVDPETVAAMIVEPVQGEGGYIVPPTSFIQKIREICDKYGIMLIFDEIQTAFGRTGKMFAYEHFGVKAGHSHAGEGHCLRFSVERHCRAASDYGSVAGRHTRRHVRRQSGGVCRFSGDD